MPTNKDLKKFKDKICSDLKSQNNQTNFMVYEKDLNSIIKQIHLIFKNQDDALILQQKPKTHTIKILENSSTDYSCDFIVFRIINNKLKIYFCEIKSSINFLDKALEQIASSKLFIKYLIECYNYYCGDNNLFKGFSMEQDTSYFYIYPKINSGNKSKIKNYAKSLLIKQVEINEKSIAIIQDTEKFFNEK